jgi:hypothetical protein
MDCRGRNETRVLHFSRGVGHVAHRCERARAIDWRHVLELRQGALPTIALAEREIPLHGE